MGGHNPYIDDVKAELPTDKYTITFVAGDTGEEHTIATWSLAPTLLPDVEFLALARPDGAEGRPEIKAIGRAKEIRGFIEDTVVERTLWGHRTYLYVWPQDIDLDEMAQRLITVDRFKREHGLDHDDSLNVSNPSEKS